MLTCKQKKCWSIPRKLRSGLSSSSRLAWTLQSWESALGGTTGQSFDLCCPTLFFFIYLCISRNRYFSRWKSSSRKSKYTPVWYVTLVPEQWILAQQKGLTLPCAAGRKWNDVRNQGPKIATKINVPGLKTNKHLWPDNIATDLRFTVKSHSTSSTQINMRDLLSNAVEPHLWRPQNNFTNFLQGSALYNVSENERIYNQPIISLDSYWLSDVTNFHRLHQLSFLWGLANFKRFEKGCAIIRNLHFTLRSCIWFSSVFSCFWGKNPWLL